VTGLAGKQAVSSIGIKYQHQYQAPVSSTSIKQAAGSGNNAAGRQQYRAQSKNFGDSHDYNDYP
jgi:hypothetical protein